MCLGIRVLIQVSPEADVAVYAEVMLVTWHTPSGYGMTPIM